MKPFDAVITGKVQNVRFERYKASDNVRLRIDCTHYHDGLIMVPVHVSNNVIEELMLRHYEQGTVTVIGYWFRYKGVIEFKAQNVILNNMLTIA